MKKLLLATSITGLLATSSLAGGGGDIFRSSLVVDQLEYQLSNEKATIWNVYAYAGYDINKVYIYSEGEKPKDESAKSENQLVYSRAISPFWDLQTGIGYDKSIESHQTWGLIGVQGLAPYFFESRATLLFGEDGNIGLRAEAEYDALLTQKLILSPSIALSAYRKDNEKMGIGSGFSNIALGTRLRYEFKREVAPYIGVEWNKNLGNTNDISPLDEIYGVIGIKFWF
ncbi:copper resistance protein B [Arcobacter sp. KX21116]|jgi:copper resistance protein B|uniref:copper resistance protein B n=1 Tax=Arcobacter iocasae TaxID=2906515 RepID=UPI0035D4C9E1|tara:strand:- start:3929 stop:4612 length:684 start_codon:yes stop_codon:yes gene_type:complete